MDGRREAYNLAASGDHCWKLGGQSQSALTAQTSNGANLARGYCVLVKFLRDYFIYILIELMKSRNTKLHPKGSTTMVQRFTCMPSAMAVHVTEGGNTFAILFKDQQYDTTFGGSTKSQDFKETQQMMFYKTI